MKRFTFIALHAAHWPVRAQCRLLAVSPSGYYAWRKRAPAAAEPTLAAWQVAAQRVFATYADRYGQRQLRAQLRREGHAAGQQRLRGWLRASNLRALCTCAGTRPPRTTQADPQAIAANKLASWPAATAPNQVWVGGITYLALATGQRAYLVCWRDAFSRRVVGWQVSESLHPDLLLTAFNRAVDICQSPSGLLLVHADRGSQYTSDAFTALLDRTQAIASLCAAALAASCWGVR